MSNTDKIESQCMKLDQMMLKMKFKQLGKCSRVSLSDQFNLSSFVCFQ